MDKLLRIVRWMTAALLLSAGAAFAAPGAPVPEAAAAAPAPAAVDALAAAKPLFDKPQKAAIIILDREVDDMMERSINRRLDIARKAGCTLIVFEMNTYGGLVTSGLNISTLIKKLPQENLHTVAWVNSKAISAGAMISVANQKIVMSAHSTIGDCGVIAISSDNALVPLPPTERAKMESPVVREFEDSAATNGYNPAVLRAMVVTAESVYEMHNFQTDEWRYVDEDGRKKLEAEEVKGAGGQVERPWKYVSEIDGKDSLLTVKNDTALKMKLSSGNVEDERQLAAALNISGDPIVLGYSWAEIATTFLSTIYVRFILFVGMLVCAWLEFSHPGISVFGVLAVICLVLLVGAPFLTGLAQIWEIVCIVAGFAIIIADLLVFGGVGMIAIPGFILLAIGLVASFIPANPGGGIMPTNQAMWNSFAWGLTVLVGGSFVAVACFYLLAKYLYMTPGLKRLQLAPAGGINPSVPLNVRDVADRSADDAVFVGALGIALSDLRPAGRAKFGDHTVGVVSYGNFIEQGAELIVLEVSGMRVVVKPHTFGVPPSGGSSEAPEPD